MNFKELKKYLPALLLLALPISGGNLGQMFISFGDIYVAGHYNTEVLAAISVASAIFMTFIITGIGLCSAVTPVLSNFRGQGRPAKKLFASTVLYSQITALVFFGALLCLIPFVNKIGLNSEILADTIEYLKISAFSIFFIFLFTALKEFLQAFEIVFFPNLMMILAVFVNLGLNFLFVHGFGIIPEMGTRGLALASLIVRALLALSLVLYCYRLFFKGGLFDFKNYSKELFKVGAPMAGAMFIEFFGFNIVAVLVGRFEPVYAAAHNIVISFASLAYMFAPFSVSSALSVKTGFANGSKNLAGIKKYTISALYFIVLYAVIVAVLFILFRRELVAFFTEDLKVLEAGSSVMAIVGSFALFDSIQGVCMGALKGLKQTVQMLAVEFLSYILVSIPIGLILAYKFNLILKGFWIGLAFGLFCAALTSGFLLIRRYFKLKAEINT